MNQENEMSQFDISEQSKNVSTTYFPGVINTENIFVTLNTLIEIEVILFAKCCNVYGSHLEHLQD